MKATKALPGNYIFVREIDLSKNVKLALLLNLAGAGLFLFFGWLFLDLSAFLRRMLPISGGSPSSPPSTLETVLGILISFFLALTLHEAVHGLFFFLVTRDRPIFGIRGAFAYAALPGWYIPRNPYLLVGLSPWLLISLAGMATVVIVPESMLLPFVFGLTINASGAVGDLAIVAWLLAGPSEALVNDRGDAIAVYYPEEMLENPKHR
jgi:hypothetical protein